MSGPLVIVQWAGHQSVHGHSQSLWAWECRTHGGMSRKLLKDVLASNRSLTNKGRYTLSESLGVTQILRAFSFDSGPKMCHKNMLDKKPAWRLG